MGPTNLQLSDRRDPPSRRADDTEHGGMPWQVRAVAFIGVPSTIAIYLVWVLSQAVVQTQASIEAKVDHSMAVTSKVGDTLDRLEQLERERTNSNRRLERYMQIMCLNLSRNDMSRAACLRVDQ